MYGILTYIWEVYGVNVGKYSIHGAYGYVFLRVSTAAFLLSRRVPRWASMCNNSLHGSSVGVQACSGHVFEHGRWFSSVN
jgi:hypothetical protein